MKQLLFGKTQNTLLQLIRYLFVGGFAAVVDTGCLYFLHSQLRMNYLGAAAIGFILGLLTNYLLSIIWVFESSGKIKEEFVLFAIIGLGGLGWTELILWLTVHFAHGPVLLAKVIALFLVLIWNFGMRKKFVFAPVSQSSHQPPSVAA
jgi:putative flippase GtrA